MKEIELKVELENDEQYQQLVELLKSKGIKYSTIKQFDNIFKLGKNELLRIRLTEDKSFITRKNLVFNDRDEFLYCDEQECIITIDNFKRVNEIVNGLVSIQPEDCVDGNTLLEKFANCNIKPRPVINKNRIEFYDASRNISLDNIEKLGHFIEIEELAKDDDTQDELTIRQSIISELESFGVNCNNIVKKGYADLISERGLI